MIVSGCLGLLLLFAVVFNLQTVLARVRQITHWLTRAPASRSASGRQVRRLPKKVPRDRMAYALRKAPVGR
jgi:hypothetical protein